MLLDELHYVFYILYVYRRDDGPNKGAETSKTLP